MSDAFNAQLQAALKRLLVVVDGLSQVFRGAAEDTVHNGNEELLTIAGLIAQVEAQVASAMEDITEANALMSNHLAAGNPHTQYILAALIGAINGVAPLDVNQKVPLLNLPQAIQGGLKYQTVWDASGGSAPSATPAQGQFWIVSVAGAFSLSGITDWNVGDWAVYDGAAWGKVDNTDQVTSVFGRMGAIVATLGDYTAALITYSNATSGLVATTAQAAIDALALRHVARRLDSNQVSTSTTLADTALTFAVAANETWQFQIDAVAQGVVGVGVMFAITAPASSTLRYTAHGINNSATAFTSTNLNGSSVTPAFAIGTNGPVRMAGAVKNGATPGTVVLQMRTENAGNNATLLAGSTLTAHRAVNV